MKSEIRAERAFNALKKIGVPVYHLGEGWSGQALFTVSGEDNYPEIWADYYAAPWHGAQWHEEVSCLDDFGVNKKINKILKKYKLCAEWYNPGVLEVYDAAY